MRSIKETVTSELVINKSVFINYCKPVSSAEEVTTILSMLRGIHPDANHYCYAYIIGKNQEIQKYSDNGEPSKTAGLPMIEVLKKQNLTNVLTVSIRFFGGIKLGAGGLVRAYTKSVSDNIKQATFTNLVKYSEMKVFIPFDQIGNVEKYLRDHYKLLQTEYTTEVIYTIELLESDVDKTQTSVTEYTKGIARFERIKTTERYE